MLRIKLFGCNKVLNPNPVCQAGLEPLCRALFLSAAQLADSLNMLYRKHVPVDGTVPPDEFTDNFVAEVRIRLMIRCCLLA